MPATKVKAKRPTGKSKRLAPTPTTRYLAVDTETTGPDLHHGCLPFAVSMMDDAGKEYYWQWKVNPHTRIPDAPRKHLKQIKEIITDSGYTPVFHNIKFDSRALQRIGIEPTWLNPSADPATAWDDTLIASHVLDSYQSHGLKDLAFFYLDIPYEDEKALRKAVQHARNLARHENRELEKQGKESRWTLGPTVDYDYWLPGQIDKDPETQALLSDYALRDAERTIHLWVNFQEVLHSELSPDDKPLYTQYLREKHLLPVVYRMEERGINIHKDKLKSEINRYTERRDDNFYRCRIIAARKGWDSFNVNSRQQLGRLLHGNPDFDTLDKTGRDPRSFNLPCTNYTGSGQYATDAETLSSLQKEAPSRNAQRFLTHYLEALKDDTAIKYLRGYDDKALQYCSYQPVRNFRIGTPSYRLHGALNQNGARTTRFSHSQPNSANISKGDEDREDSEGDRKLRSVFGPPHGFVWYPIDYQQLQLRIFAYGAGDKSMIRAFEKGYNFHEFVASCIFKCEPEEVTKLQKRIGKNVNFGFIFGAGPSKIERTAGMPGLWDVVTKLFPSAHSFMETMIRQARRQGCVYTAGGYRLTVPKDKAYIATNYYVQGSEGDIVKNAMIEVDEYLSHDIDEYHTMTMQIHDELVFQFPLYTESKHPRHLATVAGLMADAGDRLGFVTPVNIERTYTDFAHAESYPLPT